MTQKFQRARSAENKAQRHASILVAARVVLERDGWDQTTLAGIAAEAGVVKSGLYRYFESREEILLRLLIVEMEDMVADIGTRVSGPMARDALAKVFAGGFIAHPMACLLISRAASVLENNVGTETMVDIKRRLMALGLDAGAIINRGAPDLGPERAAEAAQMVYVMVAGLWPMSHPPAHVAQVLQRPEFAGLHLDFAGAIERASCAMFAGLSSR